MIFTETKLLGAYIIDIEPIKDQRGFFARTWCSRVFENQGLVTQMVQYNISFNYTQGTVRGLHYQVAPHSEVKLFKCIRGTVYHIIVDLRPESSTYKSWIAEKLSDKNRRMLYVPEGFASGYQTLEDNCEVFYQVSEYYKPNSERGIRWNDPSFGITWPTQVTIVSDKDKSFPDFES